MSNIKLIDLCAGTGAFSKAFENLNVKTVFSNDICKYSKLLYDTNFTHKLTHMDLLDVNNIPEHDILTAGFPCQSFSIAGKQLGFNDNRGLLIWKILKIAEKNNTEYLILENVKNLLTHDNKKTFNIILEKLKELKYFVKWNILNTSKITGIPQHRERLYIVCFKTYENYLKFNFDFELIEKKQINEFLETDILEKYYYLPTSKIYNCLREGITKKNTIYQYRRHYIREKKNNELPTLTANMGTGGHNVPIILDDKGIRKLTPRECFNFQGFPKTYIIPDNISDCNLYKLAGNAVSLPIVTLIAEKLLK